MRPTSSVCDPARLSRLLDSGLEPAEETETIRHLDSCAPCQKALESMAAGSGLWGVARHLDDLWDPEQVVAAREATRDLGPHADRAAVDDATLDVLEPAGRPELLGMLGSYEILRVVGRGGMGIVFHAFDAALGRQVAIKVLAPELSTSGQARRRFAREAQATAAIVHDHVIAIHAVEANARLPYLVMQYVPGHSLHDRINRDGPLELAEILRIGMQVASGLAAAHVQGVIHRDIKPANILLENGVERVKITDFGLARALDDANLTQSGVITGTPQYMAPEQARGEPVDHRADLFSLGSLLYTMCTGRSPFRADSTMAVLRRVVDDHPRPIREVNPAIPGWLEAIVSRLHAKDPAGRFGSAVEVAVLLGCCLAHVQQPETAPLPVELVESSNGPRRRGLRRRPAAVAGLVILGVLAAGEATGVTRLADAVVSVLRIKTDDGTLLVEISDPNVKVRIDDQELIIQGAGLKEVRLRPGFHTLRTRPPGGTERAELIEITRGGSVLARVSREPEPAKVLEPGASSAPSPPPESNAAFEELAARLREAERQLNALNAASPDPVAAARRVWENTVKHLREEIQRRWPDEARAAERDRILKQVDEFQAELKAGVGPKELASLQNIVTRLEKLRDELAPSKPDNDRTAELDRALQRRLQEQFDRIRALNQETQSLLGKTKADDRARHPAAPGTLEAIKGRFVRLLAFSPDGTTLAMVGAEVKSTGSRTAIAGGELFVRDVQSGRVRMSGTEPQPIESVAFSPDGRTIATAGRGIPLALRDVQSGRVLNTLSIGEDAAPMRAAVFSPDGRTIATTGVRVVRLWDCRSGRELRSLISPGGFVTSVDFASDGKTLLSTGSDNKLRQWDVATGQMLLELNAHTRMVYCVAIAPRNDIAATTSADRTVKLWDLAQGRELATIEGHTESVRKAAFSPDGKILATLAARSKPAEGAGEVILWDVASRAQRHSISPGKESFSSLAFSPDGKILATATYQGTVQLWDMGGEKPVPLEPGTGSDKVEPAQAAVPVLSPGAILYRTSIGLYY